jgi:hypothetical protein
MFHRFVLLTASIAVFAAPVAHAQKDVASCKPVLDAMAKLAVTPYHLSGTTTTPGTGVISVPIDLISTGGQNYLVADGHWVRSPMTAAQMAAQEQDNIRTAKVFSCHSLRDESVGGEAAVVYSSHSESDESKGDAQVWIAKGSGLILRMEADIDPQDVDHTHISTHYDYANVHAPAGVK